MKQARLVDGALHACIHACARAERPSERACRHVTREKGGALQPQKKHKTPRPPWLYHAGDSDLPVHGHVFVFDTSRFQSRLFATELLI